MPHKQPIFANNEFYHAFNRGVEKRTIFLDKRDYSRFIQTLEYYQIKNPPRFSFRKRPNVLKRRGISSSLVEIISFCFMPNHFHLLLKQIEDNGITTFMSKLTNSYTKYFNTRYNRVGPLTQGTFKAVRIENDEQLLHVSRYIHLNPIIDYLVKDLKLYEYSSYPEFIGRKKGFCQTHHILNHFSSPKQYEEFVLEQEDYGRTIKSMERLLLERLE